MNTVHMILFMGLIGLLNIGIWSNYDCPSVVAPKLKDQWNFTTSNLGQAYSFYSFPNLFVPIAYGYLMDRAGPLVGLPVFLLLCEVLVAVASVTIWLGGRGIGVFLAARVVMGLGGEFVMLCQYAATSRWFPLNKLGVANAIVMMVGMVSLACLFNIFPMIADSSSLSTAFATSAAAAVVALCLSLVYVVIHVRCTRRASADKTPDVDPNAVELGALEKGAAAAAVDAEVAAAAAAAAAAAPSPSANENRQPTTAANATNVVDDDSESESDDEDAAPAGLESPAAAAAAAAPAPAAPAAAPAKGGAAANESNDVNLVPESEGDASEEEEEEEEEEGDEPEITIANSNGRDKSGRQLNDGDAPRDSLDDGITIEQRPAGADDVAKPMNYGAKWDLAERAAACKAPFLATWQTFRRFPPMYWLLTVCCGFNNGLVQTFIAFSTDLLAEKWGVEDTTAARLSSIVVMTPIVCSLPIGLFIDKYGHRLTGLVACSAALICVYSVLAFVPSTPSRWPARTACSRRGWASRTSSTC
eukprot:m51a1_g10150 hypothetical protein (530) ;mRNA; r:106-2038